MTKKITCLPEEVITMILKDKRVSIENVVNFQSTCRKYHHIQLNNKFWEKKYYQRCPTAKKKYNKEKQEKIFNDFKIDFKEEIKLSLEYITKIKQLQHLVIVMFENNLSDSAIKILKSQLHFSLEHYLCTIAKNSTLYYFVVDELNRIISAKQLWESSCNLTSIYDLGIFFRRLKQHRVMYKTDKFMNMPKEKQLFERLFTIAIQYFQPHVSYSAIKTWLDEIAKEVLSRLKNIYPAHSIFSIPDNQFFIWRDNNINDNYWNETEARQIMNVLEEFVFLDLKDHKLLKFDIEDKYIDFISECVKKYLLSPFIYDSVARRLGIRCVLRKKWRDDIVIIWEPKYDTEDMFNAEYFYVNEDSSQNYPLNILRGRCNDIHYYPFCFPSMIEWIFRNIFIDKLLKINITSYKWEISILRRLFRGERDIIIKPMTLRFDMLIKEKQPKVRTHEVKYAIGMIVQHLAGYYLNIGDSSWTERYNNHVGVIIGWHFKCKSTLIKESSIVSHWDENNDVHICEHNSGSNVYNQPHYLILTERAKICYVPQCIISRCPPKWIDNVEIGRYFCRFEGTHYAPNEWLARIYSKDYAAVLESVSLE
ncbi:uncharacterized protein [Anoplolepis gracilipes]|uniref:uncharacterized protein n=1 Tax=Anoplolepis gracilipes TaxID=354296 RepID=UPI003B9F0D07